MLFMEVIRLLKAQTIDYVFLENVAGLLSARQSNNFKKVIAELSKSGFECKWTSIEANNVGLPQKRKRAFILSIRNNEAEFQRKVPKLNRTALEKRCRKPWKSKVPLHRHLKDKLTREDFARIRLIANCVVPLQAYTALLLLVHTSSA